MATKKKKELTVRGAVRQREIGLDGEALKAAREKRGWTQLELVTQARGQGLLVTPAQISTMESGRADCSTRTLAVLRRILGVSAETLLRK